MNSGARTIFTSIVVADGGGDGGGSGMVAVVAVMMIMMMELVVVVVANHACGSEKNGEKNTYIHFSHILFIVTDALLCHRAVVL